MIKVDLSSFRFISFSFVKIRITEELKTVTQWPKMCCKRDSNFYFLTDKYSIRTTSIRHLLRTHEAYKGEALVFEARHSFTVIVSQFWLALTSLHDTEF